VGEGGGCRSMRRDWTGGMEQWEGCRGSVTWREARIGELAGAGLKFRTKRRGRADLNFGVAVSCVGFVAGKWKCKCAIGIWRRCCIAK
jgi:hypothetical protein